MSARVRLAAGKLLFGQHLDLVRLLVLHHYHDLAVSTIIICDSALDRLACVMNTTWQKVLVLRVARR